jgi:hypothetical protein
VYYSRGLERSRGASQVFTQWSGMMTSSIAISVARARRSARLRLPPRERVVDQLVDLRVE